MRPCSVVCRTPDFLVLSYYHVEVDGQINTDAAWYYPYLKSAAARTKGYIAFWRGVQVEI
ncbi:MAG TPA: DUF427 domain-containing protein [Roseiflexaceae bacterium]|nr:DUF427 domain-containing protein [Roseiflexaceae bacterium]